MDPAQKDPVINFCLCFASSMLELHATEDVLVTQAAMTDRLRDMAHCGIDTNCELGLHGLPFRL